MAKLKLEVGKYYRTRDGRKVKLYYSDTRAPELPYRHDCGEADGYMAVDAFGVSCLGECDLDLIAEWTDTPTIGTLAEIGAQVGDVVEWQDDSEVTKHTITMMTSRADVYPLHAQLDSSMLVPIDDAEYRFRIISRASDAKSPVELSVDLGEAIKQVVAESQSGPVQLRKVIVPGVYGRVEVSDIYGLSVSAINMVTRDDLTAAIATLTAIRDAL